MLGPDRDLGRDHVGPEGLLERVERAEEVGPLAVEHVHEDEPREALLVRALPEPLGVDLDPHDRVDDDDRRVDDAQRAQGLGDEGLLAGRVDQVDLAVRVVERRHARADRHRALLLVFLEVGDRGAVVDLPQPVDDPGLEQERLAETGLPAPPMADQRDVADPVGGLVPHGLQYMSSAPGVAYGRLANRERSASTALVWSWETRDSVTPSTSPISRRVRFS